MSFLCCCWTKEDHEEMNEQMKKDTDNVYQDALGTIRVKTLCTPPVLSRNSYSITPTIPPEAVAVLVILEPPHIKKGCKGSISSQQQITTLSQAVREEAATNYTPSVKRRFTFTS